MSNDISVWPETIRLGEAVRFIPAAPLLRELTADEATRKQIARSLDLRSLQSLTAELRLSGWFDGLQIEGRWRAEATQTCGVSLEEFAVSLHGDFELRVVPSTSPHAAVIEEPEIEVDLDADDPPDVLDGDVVDLGRYVIEHLALEIDPFPRKPGAVFEAPQPTVETSPFAILRALKGSESGGDA